MRRVPLNMVDPDMKLARPILHNNRLLLKQGTMNLRKYEYGLNNLGIYSVYIDDGAGMDIEIPDALNIETKNQCKVALESTFTSLGKQGTFDIEPINDAVTVMIDDLLSKDDILFSLNEISTLDDNTMVHSLNTAVLSILIGKELHLSSLELNKLAEGAILHDIGKIALDQEILLKAGSLTDEEFNHIKNHTQIGYDMLKKNSFVSELSRIISLQHHERLDGSGYPNHLQGKELHSFVQITAMADMYDALTAERCYRKSMSNYHAYQILMKDAAIGKINPAFLAHLLKNVAIYPNGITVQLSDNTTGIVKAQNVDMPFRPVVRVIDNIRDEGTVALYDVDLMKALDLTILEPDE